MNAEIEMFFSLIHPVAPVLDREEMQNKHEYSFLPASLLVWVEKIQLFWAEFCPLFFLITVDYNPVMLRITESRTTFASLENREACLRFACILTFWTLEWCTYLHLNICPILFALFLIFFFITIAKYYRFTEWFLKDIQYLYELIFSYLETRTLDIFQELQ